MRNQLKRFFDWYNTPYNQDHEPLMRKIIPIMIMVVLIGAPIAYGLNVYYLSIQTKGKTTTGIVGLYLDEEGTLPLGDIDWGVVDAGSNSTTQTFFIVNGLNRPITLNDIVMENVTIGAESIMLNAIPNYAVIGTGLSLQIDAYVYLPVGFTLEDWTFDIRVSYV